MKIVEITSDRFSDWKRLRQAVSPDVNDDFHDREIELIASAADATAFLGLSENGEPIALLDASIRAAQHRFGSPVITVYFGRLGR